VATTIPDSRDDILSPGLTSIRPRRENTSVRVTSRLLELFAAYRTRQAAAVERTIRKGLAAFD
jgi:hypothetical protein